MKKILIATLLCLTMTSVQAAEWETSKDAQAKAAEWLRKRPDDLRIRHLKKLKLTIKDRLLRLSGGQRSRVMA